MSNQIYPYRYLYFAWLAVMSAMIMQMMPAHADDMSAPSGVIDENAATVPNSTTAATAATSTTVTTAAITTAPSAVSTLKVTGQSSGDGTILTIHKADPNINPLVISISTDNQVEPGKPGVSVKKIAEAGDFLIITDTYPSRMGPLAFCQSGKETFLRVLDLQKSAEALKVKVESCRQNLELEGGSAGIVWDGETKELSVNWLLGPSGRGQSQVYKIGSTGKVTLKKH